LAQAWLPELRRASLPYLATVLGPILQLVAQQVQDQHLHRQRLRQHLCVVVVVISDTNQSQRMLHLLAQRPAHMARGAKYRAVKTLAVVLCLSLCRKELRAVSAAYPLRLFATSRTQKHGADALKINC
jgi:hypothetical protein